MTRVAVTGAGGFIGRGVVAALSDAGFAVRALVREGGSRPEFGDKVEVFALSSLGDEPDALVEAIRDAATIVHLADNPDRTGGGTRSPELATAVVQAARSSGVNRIVFASSIYARLKEGGQDNAYGAGKRAAERILAEAEGLDTVSLRLPPVYGPGGKGGFALVARLVETGIPLPLGQARAKRAYLSRDNLASLVVALAKLDDAQFATAAARIWEPSDQVPLSTAELARTIGAATGRTVRMLPIPAPLLTLPAAMLGKRAAADAIFAGLECDDPGELERLTGWRPSRDMMANLAYLRT